MPVESSLNLLNEMVEKLGLTAVAEAIKYSKSAVCHVQRGTYKGKAEKVLAKVEEVFSQHPVECPVLGEILYSRCIEEKNRPFAATNPLRVRLARTCRTCGQGEETEVEKMRG
jgi:hypothetical protein